MAKKMDYEMLSALRDELNAILGDSAEEQETTAKKTKKSDTAEDYESMTYNELKKLCKSQGLSAAGNREELIARLNGEGDSDEDEEPVKKSTAKKGSKKSAPAEEDDDSDDEDGDDDDDEDDDGEDVQSAVEAATEDMSLEELAEFCEENGLSSKGKRQALIARIVKAVEAGDIELSDDDDEDDDEEDEEEEVKPSKKPGGNKSNRKKVDDDDDDDDSDDDDEVEPTKERIAALKSYKKDTTSQFKKGELERDDLIEFLCDFHDKDKKAYKKMSDADVLAAYIEASSNLINDEGEIVEEGAYTVNGVPFCCGHPLTYNEDDEQYVCEHCGGEYEADEE